MARLADRHPGNADGDWYVDSRCIDCSTCRELAPDSFGLAHSQSVVVRQPGDAAATTSAWRAAVACPTQSIGTRSRQRRPDGLFPLLLEEFEGGAVYYCGFCSEHSYGASSYLVVHPDGNLLVDAPRWSRLLADPVARLGGIGDVLLTHCDDVADARLWAERFGARVWIHADDSGAAPFATDVVPGRRDVEIRPGLTVVPLPGHTAGSVAYLLAERYLFSGDSLAWRSGADGAHGDLVAFPDVCWYSWTEQARSLEALAERHRFSWVLPGHGGRCHRDADDLHRRLVALVARMARR